MLRYVSLDQLGGLADRRALPFLKQLKWWSSNSVNLFLNKDNFQIKHVASNKNVGISVDTPSTARYNSRFIWGHLGQNDSVSFLLNYNTVVMQKIDHRLYNSLSAQLIARLSRLKKMLKDTRVRISGCICKKTIESIWECYIRSLSCFIWGTWTYAV